jgi:hypothetical protein
MNDCGISIQSVHKSGDEDQYAGNDHSIISSGLDVLVLGGIRFGERRSATGNSQ